MTRVRFPRRVVVGLAAVALGLTGCGSAVKWTGIRVLYRPAAEPERVVRDVIYRAGSDDPKHRLDLFAPAGEGWPILVFVHGGGWTRGDKGLEVAGADVYGNIGRFYAGHGIGTAIVNYRLQPAVGWREQVADVAHAVAWVRSEIAPYGGDPGAVFLGGHSAGAQLAAFTALAAEPLAELGHSPTDLCGVIPVSGLAFDLADEETYRLGAKRPYYEERFHDGGESDAWQRAASAITYVTASAPPFLLLHGAWEWKALAHQNRLLDRALGAAGVSSELRIVRQRHATMVLALSRPDRLPAQAILEFVRGASCGPS